MASCIVCLKVHAGHTGLLCASATGDRNGVHLVAEKPAAEALLKAFQDKHKPVSRTPVDFIDKAALSSSVLSEQLPSASKAE